MRNTADGEYINNLAGQLRRSPTVTRATEDELARMRRVTARVAEFINNPNHDLGTRTALAEHLGLPAPRTNAPKGVGRE